MRSVLRRALDAERGVRHGAETSVAMPFSTPRTLAIRPGGDPAKRLLYFPHLVNRAGIEPFEHLVVLDLDGTLLPVRVLGFSEVGLELSRPLRELDESLF